MNREEQILVACEETGRVRDALIAQGYDAVSCDLLPSRSPGPHIQADVRTILNDGWGMMIAFPDCTYLCSSGLHWNTRRPERKVLTEEAAKFFMLLSDAPIKRKAIENPIGCMSTRYRKPDQIIQPWQYGEDASKATCLWLTDLPLLIPTGIIKKERYGNQTASGQNKLGPSADRARLRSATYPGIADAMAKQWGHLIRG